MIVTLLPGSSVQQSRVRNDLFIHLTYLYTHDNNGSFVFLISIGHQFDYDNDKQLRNEEEPRLSMGLFIRGGRSIWALELYETTWIL